MSKIGELIRKYRLMRGLTQHQLAEAVGITTPGLTAYETGDRTPKIELRQNIANALSVDPVALSGIELSKDDEIRILNKLLVKYADDIEPITKSDESNKIGKISVTLSSEFTPLSEEYREYKNDLAVSHFDDSLFENAEGSSDDESDLDIDAKKELDFWLETWPTYDYMHRANYADAATKSSGRHSIKERVRSEFMVAYYNYNDKCK